VSFVETSLGGVPTNALNGTDAVGAKAGAALGAVLESTLLPGASETSYVAAALRTNLSSESAKGPPICFRPSSKAGEPLLLGCCLCAACLEA